MSVRFLSSLTRFVNVERITLLAQSCWRQCNALTTLKLRHSVRHTYNYYKHAWRQRRRPAIGGTLISAVLFSLERDGIDDDDLDEIADEMDADFGRNVQVSDANRTPPLDDKLHRTALEETQCADGRSWELVMSSAHFIMYRRPIAVDSYVMEYKCLGRYFDVTPTSFFRAQIDIDYRKQWDSLVIHLDVLELNEVTGDEVVRWVTYFPWPMASREYVFVRRSCIDTDAERMVVATRSVEHHPRVPDHSAHVRVHDYESTMLIRPHSTFEEKGMDYVLTYIDDPKAPFPGPAYRWMVNYGVPSYVGKVHTAAIKLDEEHARA